MWISQQFNPVSLTDHLVQRAPVGPRPHLRRHCSSLHPRAGQRGAAPASRRARAEALWSQAELIRQFDPDALVVVSADAVYKLDYCALAEEHCEAGKAVTMVTTEVEPEDADRYGVVQLERRRRSPTTSTSRTSPRATRSATRSSCSRPSRCWSVLDELEKERGQDDLDDLGHHLLPRLVTRARRGRTGSTATGATWARSTPSTHATWSSSRTSRRSTSTIPLADPHARDREPRVGAGVLGASIASSLIAPGAKVAGDVSGSVLGRGVVVEKGATVRDSVLLPGRDRARRRHRHRAIIDDHVDVRADVGEPGGAIALIGLHTTVDETLPAGARYPEVDSD